MRILTIVSDLNLGGTQRVAQNFAIAYKKLQWKSELLALRTGGERSSTLIAAGIEPRVGSSGRKHVLNSTYDVVHLHGPGNYDSEFADFLRQLRLGNPRALILETNVFSRPDYSEAQKFVDIHLHLTRWGLAKWRSWTSNRTPQPIGTVIPNLVHENAILPLDQANSDKWRSSFNIAPDAFVALRVGQPIPSKWSQHTFEAFAQFSKANKNVVFVGIGIPTKYETLVKKLNSTRRRVISIEPRFDDHFLSAAYHASDVFLHSAAIGESFGMVLAEASLAEKPIITLARPLKDNGHVEVVEHGITGLICNDVHGMTIALNEIYKDRNLAKTLGKNGRQHILRSYTEAAVLPKLGRLIELGSGHHHKEERRRAICSGGYNEFASLAELSQPHKFLGRNRSRADWMAGQLLHEPNIYAAYYRLKSSWSRLMQTAQSIRATN